MDTMKEEKQSVAQMIKINFRGLSLIHRLIPWNYFWNILYVTFEILYRFWSFFFLARLIDHTVQGAARGILISDVAILVAGEMVVHMVFQGLQNFYFYCGSNIWEWANVHLNEKIMSMDYEYMESEMVHNRRRDIDAAARSYGHGINQLFWNFTAAISSTTNLIVSLGYILYLISRCRDAFTGKPVQMILFIVVFVCLFALLIALIARKNSSAQKQINNIKEGLLPYFRQSDYYVEEYIEKEECGKAIRMFHQQPLLAGRLSEVFEELYQGFHRIGRIHCKKMQWISVMEMLISGLIYFMLGYLVLKQAITIGSVCLYAGCISNFLSYFNYWVEELIQLKNNTKYIIMYFDFLDIPNKKYEGTLPIEKRDDDQFTIEFRHVSFRYPGSDRDVLKDFSIQFRIGERLAVVGKNGSGKTTFIKLLCRLYDPTEGEILLNGINIQKYDYREYLQLFSVVFQDFKIPAYPIGQNVASSVEYDAEKVMDSLRQAGLEDLIQRMPEGLETPIYTDFDKNGVDISGGEAQKLAIARALYHDTPFVILDEPTAALDPLAEYEIYSKFDELIGTKTAVYISHRLSSCQFCNDILVIEDGKAVQRGSHEKLVKDTEGLYYTLWHTQAQYYQTEGA